MAIVFYVEFGFDIHIRDLICSVVSSMHESEPNTLNHFQDKLRLKFTSKSYVIIDVY
jgi:hypothetical protein